MEWPLKEASKGSIFLAYQGNLLQINIYRKCLSFSGIALGKSGWSVPNSLDLQFEY